MSVKREPISLTRPKKEKLPEADPDVTWDTETAPRPKTAQEKMIDLEPPKPAKKKRGPGRPRKRPPTPPPEPVHAPAPMPAGLPTDDAPLDSDAKAAIADKVGIIRKINLLKSKLNAVGTGMVPDASMPLAMLEAELQMLSSEVDMRRADGVLEHMFKKTIPPLIMQAAAIADPTKATVDLDNFDKEVDENWDLMFKDAIIQLSIMYGDWFSVGPLATVGKNLGECALSANAKNQARKKFMEAQERAKQEMAMRGLAPTVDNDDDSDPDADRDDKV